MSSGFQSMPALAAINPRPPGTDGADANDLGVLARRLSVAAVSLDLFERLTAARPATLAAAGRIRGITPAALTAILLHATRAAA